MYVAVKRSRKVGQRR